VAPLVDKVTTEQVLSADMKLSPANYHSTNSLEILSSQAAIINDSA